MIRSALLLALFAGRVLAAEPDATAKPPPQAADAPADATKDPAKPKDAPKPDPGIDAFRLSVEEINERMVGTTSQAVRYNWRRMKVGVGATGSSLLELNNFGSSRFGVIARRPIFGLLGEVAITRVSTWSTPSSDLLSLTPYRQAGRPSRFELDVNAGFPLAEGVVTAWPSFFPATQLVFSANAGLRYLFYPGSVKGMTFLDASRALISPYLDDAEVANLEKQRNPGMAIDRARYSLLVGLSTDLYFHQGLFFSPRALVAIPLLSGVNSNAIGFWWELSCGLGWAF